MSNRGTTISLADLERRQWTLRESSPALTKSWRFPDWREAVMFAELVLERGAAAGLRPAVSIRDDRVSVLLEAESGDDLGPEALRFASTLDLPESPSAPPLRGADARSLAREENSP